MKKIVLAFAVVLSMTACTKSNSESSNSEMVSDSLSGDTSVKFDSIQKSPNITDSTNVIKKDTLVINIQDLNDQKRLLTEKVAKTMDSATKAEILSEIKIAQKKIDSVKNRLVSNFKTKKSTPKIIRETKVVYRDLPKPKIVTPKITKKGELEIHVQDLEIAQYDTKAQLAKYDGTVLSEQILTNSDDKYDYMQLRLPLDKSEYFIDDLERNVGKIVARNIEITGKEGSANAFCYLEVTLTDNSQKALAGAGSKSFGGRTLGAVGSGWNVIQEIFLFILPFWPLALIGGGIFYFLKKRKTQEIN